MENNKDYQLIYSEDFHSKSKFVKNKKVKIYGWVHKVIKFKKFYLIWLRDFSGIIRCKYSKINLQDFVVKKESVVCLYGHLEINETIDKKTKQTKEDLFLIVTKYQIINKSLLPKFKIENQTDGLEKLRLEYRYLDLRRDVIKENVFNRHLLYRYLREFFYLQKNFYEIDTPILSSPTIEGARSFLVESMQKNKYFALPQSPQLYKQLLMAGGIPNYFQICHCFRNEDMREDRQPEFMQLDLEMNFKKMSEVMNLIEKLMKFLWKKLLNIELKLPFKVISYQDALKQYQTDKPDSRLDDVLKIETFPSFTKKDFVCKGFFLKMDVDAQKINDFFIKPFQKSLQKITSHKLLYVLFKSDNNLYKQNLCDKDLQNIINIKQKKFSINQIVHWIGFYETPKIVDLMIAKGKKYFGNWLFINSPNTYKRYHFFWIINPKMFTYDDKTKKYQASHHPFSQPQDEAIFNSDFKKAKINAFDLVCNGVEIGSGGERIYKRNLQEKVFEILKISKKDYQESFGFLLDAMEYGYPFHSGMAIGIERLMMVIENRFNIRDFIAFPKTSKSTSLLTKTPRKVKDL